MSASGIRDVSGASASKMNLLTPTGTGPTRSESSSWSYWSLASDQQGAWPRAAGDLRLGRADIGELPLEVCQAKVRRCGGLGWHKQNIPFSSCSRHSNVISNSYLSVNLAGLLTTLTPRRETTDILCVEWVCEARESKAARKSWRIEIDKVQPRKVRSVCCGVGGLRSQTARVGQEA